MNQCIYVIMISISINYVLFIRGCLLVCKGCKYTQKYKIYRFS